MARFKIFNPTTGKDESMSGRQIDQKTKKSAQWFRDSINGQFKKPPSKAAQLARNQLNRGAKKANKYVNQNATLKDPAFKQNLRTVKLPEIGRLYMYVYDPKHKQTLPYYDVFPMTFVMDFYNDGFLGMNMHYLNPLLRARLMEELLKHQKTQTRKGKKEQYLDISYYVLKAAGANKYFKPTIKRYLFDHVRSPFAEVLEPQWENAVFMPTEQFRKKGRAEVWSDSKAMMR